ncbi:MAG: SGNH/GDSL hydrolase family protein [Dehalococcoidia bacterium]
MRRFHPVYLLPAVLVMALVLGAKDVPFDGAGIAFIGDSLTLGAAATSPAEAFPSLVSEDLDRQGVEEQARFFLSFNPNTDIIAARNAMKHDRRFVIIEIGIHATNDLQITADQFRQMYGSLLDCVTGGDTIVVAGTVAWFAWNADSPNYQRAGVFSQIIAEEAAKRDIAVADVWTATKLQVNLISTPEDKTFLGTGFGDNNHPNDAGHAVIAHVYEQAISRELADPPHRPFDRQCH